MALEHTKQTAYVGTHAQHNPSTHTHRNTHSYSLASPFDGLRHSMACGNGRVLLDARPGALGP